MKSLMKSVMIISFLFKKAKTMLNYQPVVIFCLYCLNIKRFYQLKSLDGSSKVSEIINYTPYYLWKDIHYTNPTK